MAVGAQEPKVLPSIVRANPVDVVKLEYERFPVVAARIAALGTAVGKEPRFVYPSLQPRTLERAVHHKHLSVCELLGERNQSSPLVGGEIVVG